MPRCASQQNLVVNVRDGSWLCENSSARRARRNISKKLRTMESNRAARAMFDTLSENCIFYISQLYEFSHRLGLGRVKTKSDLVVMLSGRQIFAFFCSPHDDRAQNCGCGYTA